MHNRYSIDIYRTDDALLIHDRPGGWKRGILGLLLALTMFVVFTMPAWLAVISFLNPIPVQQAIEPKENLNLSDTVMLVLAVIVVAPVFGFAIFSCVAVFLFSLWRIGGHETVLIDRDSIRRDWWCFWGRRSRILPRPERISTETCPGFLMFGGQYGVKICLGKRPKWFGRRKIEKFLPIQSERQWLFDEITRFQQEVPAAQPVDEARPVEKGAYSDSTYGANLLATQELNGKRLDRVIPDNKSAATEETTERCHLGVLQVRCIKCHRIVPDDHVFSVRLIAQCPHCATVFQLNELERTDLPHRCRLHVRRDDDSLTIAQCPLRTGMPLYVMLTFLLMDAACVALYFYLQNLFPDENPVALLQAENNFDITAGVAVLAVMHVLFLLLPFWAMFDKRTIFIDRETLQITGSWLFLFRWRRNIPRLLVKRARYREWEKDFYQAKLCYSNRSGHGNRSIYIGCRSEEEVGMICAEINHFLYTVPPWPVEYPVFPFPEPAFIGGVESGSPAIHLHCPDCGAQYPAASLDFPHRTAHCSQSRYSPCQKTTPLETVVVYPINKNMEDRPADGLLVEKTDDRLFIQYTRDMEKGMKYFYLGSFYFDIIFLSSMMILVTYLLVTDKEISTFGFYGILLSLVLPMSAAIFFLSFKLSQEKNTIYCDWTIHITRDEITLEHCYKNRRKTIVIPREEIVCIEQNRDYCAHLSWGEFFSLGTYPVGFFENRMSAGTHVLLTDGTRQYLPLTSLKTNSSRDATSWLAATLNEFLASHPVW